MKNDRLPKNYFALKYSRLLHKLLIKYGYKNNKINLKNPQT